MILKSRKKTPNTQLCGVMKRLLRCHPRRRSPSGRSDCKESSRTRTTGAIDTKPVKPCLTIDLSDRTLDTAGSSDSSATHLETDDHVKGRPPPLAKARPPQHLRADNELDVSLFSSSAVEVLPGVSSAQPSRMAKRRCRFADETSGSSVVTKVWHVPARAPDDAGFLHYSNDDIESFRRVFLEERALECAVDIFGGNNVVTAHRTIRGHRGATQSDGS